MPQQEATIDSDIVVSPFNLHSIVGSTYQLPDQTVLRVQAHAQWWKIAPLIVAVKMSQRLGANVPVCAGAFIDTHTVLHPDQSLRRTETT